MPMTLAFETMFVRFLIGWGRPPPALDVAAGLMQTELGAADAISPSEASDSDTAAMYGALTAWGKARCSRADTVLGAVRVRPPPAVGHRRSDVAVFVMRGLGGHACGGRGVVGRCSKVQVASAAASSCATSAWCGNKQTTR